MPRAREETTRDPAVILDLVFEDGLFFFELINVTSAPVYKVSVQFTHEITSSMSEKPVTGIQLFKNLTFLAPEKKIRVFVDTSRSYFARRQPTRFTATIRYQDAEGRRFNAEIPHNVGIYRDFPFIRHVEPDRRGELPSPRIDTGR